MGMDTDGGVWSAFFFFFRLPRAGAIVL